ncbi:MAG: ArsR family transcriptional regulator [Bacteroidales bacterium]|nr:ArsR family transcriptional regulator [Bacteroidales bacterium]
MLEALITSKTRIKLLLKFFLNSNSTAYLRSLETEFGESTNAIRLELNRFEAAGLLKSDYQGNKKIFRANTQHPLFPEINNLLLKHVGIDRIIEKITSQMKNVSAVYLVGKLATGADEKIIDLWFAGENIDKKYLIKLMEKVENLLDRKIRYIFLSDAEKEEFLESKKPEEILLLWKK